MVNFQEWMISDGLSQSSATKYDGAIYGPLTTWAQNLIPDPITEIVDPVEFAAVAKMLSGTPEYRARNVTGHQMYSAALKKFEKYLTYLSVQQKKEPPSDGPFRFDLHVIESEEELSPFNPKSLKDARERVLCEVVRRRGQAKFRHALITAYEGRCAITGCALLAILEAAHITPYMGGATNRVSNGLLLRADLHTLWDLGLIAIVPDKNTFWVNPRITDATYRAIDGTAVFQPADLTLRPASLAIMQQWKVARELL
jgi:hypothetical protein